MSTLMDFLACHEHQIFFSRIPDNVLNSRVFGDKQEGPSGLETT